MHSSREAKWYLKRKKISYSNLFISRKYRHLVERSNQKWRPEIRPSGFSSVLNELLPVYFRSDDVASGPMTPLPVMLPVQWRYFRSYFRFDDLTYGTKTSLPVRWRHFRFGFRSNGVTSGLITKQTAPLLVSYSIMWLTLVWHTTLAHCIAVTFNVCKINYYFEIISLKNKNTMTIQKSTKYSKITS